MVGGSLRVLRLRPPLNIGAMILLKVALSTIKQIKYIKEKKQVPFLSIVQVYRGCYGYICNIIMCKLT